MKKGSLRHVAKTIKVGRSKQTKGLLAMHFKHYRQGSVIGVIRTAPGRYRVH